MHKLKIDIFPFTSTLLKKLYGARALAVILF